MPEPESAMSVSDGKAVALQETGLFFPALELFEVFPVQDIGTLLDF